MAAAYITLVIVLGFSIVFAVGFGKFFFERMIYTDAQFSVQQNRDIEAMMCRRAKRFSAAWRWARPLGLLMVVGGIEAAIVNALV